jgi:hypothetical protein
VLLPLFNKNERDFFRSLCTITKKKVITRSFEFWRTFLLMEKAKSVSRKKNGQKNSYSIIPKYAKL